MKKQWRCHLNVHAIWGLWKQKKAIVVVLIVLIACGLTFYAMGIRQKQELSMYQNRITLFQKDRQFYTYEDAVQMRQRNEEIKEPFSYVIWGTEGIHLLENQDLGRSSRVEVYAIDGNSQMDAFWEKKQHRNCLVLQMLPDFLLRWTDIRIRYLGC